VRAPTTQQGDSHPEELRVRPGVLEDPRFVKLSADAQWLYLRSVEHSIGLGHLAVTHGDVQRWVSHFRLHDEWQELVGAGLWVATLSGYRVVQVG